MNRIEEINARLAEIRADMERRADALTEAEIDAYETEVQNLTTERAALMAAAERRNSLLSRIAQGSEGTVVRTFSDGGAERPENIRDTEEYRVAFLRGLQGHALTDREKRDMSSATSSAGVAIPTHTQNEIIRKVKETAPLLDEITLLHVAGNVTFAVEGTVADVNGVHTENAAVTPAADTLVSVSLAGYELVKLIRISATVRTMAVNAFEDWLTDMLADKIALAIEHFLVNGTGTNQPKGVAGITYSAANGNLTKYAAAKPTAAEVFALIGSLASRHARKAKFLMHRTTLWADFWPIRDDAKAPIVTGNGAGGYNVCGYPVMFSDEVAVGDVYFGNFKMIVGNLADDIRVASSEHSGFGANAIDYRGTAIFDSDIADEAAFVKGERKTT